MPTPGAVHKATPGGPVIAIGDSVMLAASDDLDQAFGKSITVDAAVGRQVDVGLQRLAEYRAAGRLHGLRALIIDLGSNGPFAASQMHQLISLTKGVPLVVLLTVRVPESWQQTSNHTIDSVAHRPGFVVVNWYQASGRRAIMYPDDVHPNLAGQSIYTNMIVKAVDSH